MSCPTIRATNRVLLSSDEAEDSRVEVAEQRRTAGKFPLGQKIAKEQEQSSTAVEGTKPEGAGTGGAQCT